MSEVITKRLMTDDTGQEIVSALEDLAAAVKPTGAEMDMSSTDTTKVKDAIETNSAAIATYNFGVHTISDLETAFASYASNMANGQFKNVIFTVSAASGIWATSSYYGTLRRDSSGRYNLFAQPMNGVAPIVTGNYMSGSWSWAELIAGKSAYSWSDGTKPTLSNGSHYGTGCYYFKIGPLVFLSISVEFTAAPTNATLFSLPAGCRPIGTAEISVSGGGSYNAKAQCQINPTNGFVQVTSVDKWVIGSGFFLCA